MTLEELRNIVRGLVNDHATSNRSVEGLTLHLDNVVDGVNKMFYLMNRRVVPGSVLFVNNGIATAPVYDEAGGYVLIDPAPPVETEGRLQYYWLRVTDDEIDVLLSSAIKDANLNDVAGITNRNERVVLEFAKANVYQFIMNHAAQYYAVSAGGKMVSKESIFQHYMQLYQTTWANAMRLRDDFYQRQGERNIPTAVIVGSDIADGDWG